MTSPLNQNLGWISKIYAKVDISVRDRVGFGFATPGPVVPGNINLDVRDRVGFGFTGKAKASKTFNLGVIPKFGLHIPADARFGLTVEPSLSFVGNEVYSHRPFFLRFTSAIRTIARPRFAKQVNLKVTPKFVIQGEQGFSEFTEENQLRINQPTPKCAGALVTLQGAGGSGGPGFFSSNLNRGGGGGGGGGARIRVFVPRSAMGATYTSSAGSGGISSVSAGNNGGDSVFQSGTVNLIAQGGRAGGTGTQTTAGTAGNGGVPTVSGVVNAVAINGTNGANGGGPTGTAGSAAPHNTNGSGPGGGGGSGYSGIGVANVGGAGGNSTHANGGAQKASGQSSGTGNAGGNATQGNPGGGGSGASNQSLNTAGMVGSRGGAAGAGGGGGLGGTTNVSTGGTGGDGYSRIDWLSTVPLPTRSPVTLKGVPPVAGTYLVGIPAHVAGDLIVIAAFMYPGGAIPGKPNAGGTVPNWQTITTGNGWHLAYHVATANNHTSGEWANSYGMIAVVLSGQAPSPIGNFATAMSTQVVGQITAPAVPLSASNNSAQLLHFFGGNGNSYSAAPSGYTYRIGGTYVALLTKNDTSTDGAVTLGANTNNAGIQSAATLEVIGAVNGW